MFIDLRERNIDLWPPVDARPEIEPATWVCALMGNRTHNLLMYGTKLQLSHVVGRGWISYLLEWWAQGKKLGSSYGYWTGMWLWSLDLGSGASTANV